MRNKYSPLRNLVFLAASFCLPRRRSRAGQADRHVRAKQLTDVYYSEGAGAGDLDADGDVDLVYGPLLVRRARLRNQARDLYALNRKTANGYAGPLLRTGCYDFDGDKYGDIFVVGFRERLPTSTKTQGKGKGEGDAGHWKKHQVFDSVSDESPYFTNIVGDDKPELIVRATVSSATRRSIGPSRWKPGRFTPSRPRLPIQKFGHGIGCRRREQRWTHRPPLPMAGGWSSPRTLKRHLAGRHTRRVSATSTAAAEMQRLRRRRRRRQRRDHQHRRRTILAFLV